MKNSNYYFTPFEECVPEKLADRYTSHWVTTSKANVGTFDPTIGGSTTFANTMMIASNVPQKRVKHLE